MLVNSQRRQAGVTLVELECTVVSALILALCVGVIAQTSAKMTVTARRECDLQRDASIAMRFLQHELRERSADEVAVSEDGETLTLEASEGESHVFQKQDGALIFNNGTTTSSIISDGVSSLSFELAEGHGNGGYLLQVTLVLSRYGLTQQAQSTISLRNL